MVFAMSYVGSRTKATDLWMLESDEAIFGENVAAVLPEAGWRCSHSGPAESHPKHVHPTVAEAFDCGGTQVFLSLPAGVDPFSGDSKAGVQLLRSVVRDGEAQMPAGTRERLAAFAKSRGGMLLTPPPRKPVEGRHFRVGRLATRWFEPEVGPQLHELLTHERDLIWQALRRSTKPAHIEYVDGRPKTGKRIGPAALEMVRSENMPLSESGPRYRLR